jgi:hypothetical protein
MVSSKDAKYDFSYVVTLSKIRERRQRKAPHMKNIHVHEQLYGTLRQLLEGLQLPFL